MGCKINPVQHCKCFSIFWKYCDEKSRRGNKEVMLETVSCTGREHSPFHLCPADQHIFIPATSQYFIMTQPSIHCLLPLNEGNETACIKLAVSQPLTIPLLWSCFPSSSPLPYFTGCVSHFVCHYSWHFPTFICQTLVVTPLELCS